MEVSQERKTIAEVLIADSANNINTDNPDQIFITGNNPNNYIWYSGKLWRAVSIDTSDNSVKLVTQWNISTISYDDNSSAFEGSNMEMWLNDTTVDGFLGNLRNPDKFIKMDNKWNASMMTDTSKPPSESEGGIIVEDSVGLLNVYEYNMSGARDGYLNNSLYWWTITANNSSANYIVNYDGSIGTSGVTNAYGIRPVVNLKPDIKIVAGDGTEDSPYRLMGDNDNNLSGTKLNTRYSGEYISFGTGENNLYRIVSHETDGLTKITSAEPLKENGNYKFIAFGGSTQYYSSNNMIGSFLNGEYLDSGYYLTSEQENMIEDNTTWYLGTVRNGSSYRLAKYTDANMSALTSNTTNAKVGLLRLGELMAGQCDRKASFWLLTNNGAYVKYLDIHSGIYDAYPQTLYSIKPTLNLKSNVIITSGDGTLQNPFEIELAS